MGLAVRGTCPKCQRVYDTEAPERRSTRRFTCATESCDGYVVARRVKGNDAPPPTPAADPNPTSRRRKKALRVDGYARQPRHSQPEPELPGPAPEPRPETPEPTPGRQPEPSPVDQPRPRADEPIEPSIERPRRRVERARRGGVTPYDDLY